MPKSLVVLTGGGTAGHVMPNFALVPEFKKRGWAIHYIGSKGMEKQLVLDQGLPFHEISVGKLRRYISVENFLDLFRIVIGCVQAIFILLKLRPAFVFSKGGFVSVPVCYAASLLKIPVVSHESDLTPGLATKLILPIAKRIFYSFPETAKYLPSNKSSQVGQPVREELLSGDAKAGLQLCGFDDSNLPVLMIIGGSSGAQRINESLLAILPKLVEKFRIIHITGRGKTLGFTHKNYRAFEFVGKELKDLFAATDLMVSRAGAGAVFEALELKKPTLFIPLEIGSRGDQILNAKSVVGREMALSMSEKDLTAEKLSENIAMLKDRAEQIKTKMATNSGPTAVEKIFLEFDQLGLTKDLRLV